MMATTNAQRQALFTERLPTFLRCSELIPNDQKGVA
jgi:hypothetical protein